jgi:hypothetical protein
MSPGPELRRSPQLPRFAARFGTRADGATTVAAASSAKCESGGEAASRLAQRRDMADFDPTMAPTMAAYEPS